MTPEVFAASVFGLWFDDDDDSSTPSTSISSEFEVVEPLATGVSVGTGPFVLAAGVGTDGSFPACVGIACWLNNLGSGGTGFDTLGMACVRIWVIVN